MSKTDCPACGRDEGHHLNCRRAPRARVPAPEPEPEEWSVCGEPECDDPVKSSTARYCVAHSTRSAANARQYRKRQEEKEQADD